MRFKKNQLAFLLIAFFILHACKKEKQKILIIGDSISMGYTQHVQQILSDKAIITRNPGNAQHTGFGVKKVNEWLGDEKWDIIHFNWGLHDLCYRHPDSKVQGNRDKVNGKITNSIEVYKSNLDSIVSMMKRKSDAKLIFLTTTYVPEYEAGRFEQDAIDYNAVAKEIMKKHDVTIHDIYEESAAIHKLHGVGNDDVHYEAEGSKELGKLIASFILEEM